MNRMEELLTGGGRGGGDGGTEGSSAIGDGVHASLPLVLDFAGTQVGIFESSKLECLYVGG